MSGRHRSRKIIAVSDGAEKEAEVLRGILDRCGRDCFTVLPAGEAARQDGTAAVLLAARPGKFPDPQKISVCVTEYALSRLPAFSGFRKLVTYSTDRDGADFTARNIRTVSEGATAFEIVGVGIIGRVRLKTDRKDSVATALAAAAAAIAAGIPFADILEALNGMDRFDW